MRNAHVHVFTDSPLPLQPLPDPVKTSGAFLIPAPPTPTQPHNPFFVKELQRGLDLALFGHRIRCNIYGSAIAEEYRPGHTPTDIREEVRRQALIFTSSSSDDEAEAEAEARRIAEQKRREEKKRRRDSKRSKKRAAEAAEEITPLADGSSPTQSRKRRKLKGG